MAKNKISEWSATAANNTDIGGIDIAEGCAPSGINNAIRELMAQVKDQQTGTDADNFTVGGNLSVTGTSTLTGNTIITGTLNVGNGDLIKDASGNLGLGVSPSAWNTATKNIQNPAGSVYSINTTDMGVAQNLFLDSTGTWKYVNTAAASYFAQTGGAFSWASVVSGTAGASASLTNKMTLDASGNLGLGVTPSVWGSGIKALQVGAVTSVYNSGNNGVFGVNILNDGTNYRYLQTAGAGYYGFIGGAHTWATAPSGTAGTVATFTQAMTLDASGNLGVGTASPAYPLDVNGTISATGLILPSQTAVTASGTSVDFTSIPSWVKRVTIMFSGVSTNGTSYKQIQLGTSGSIEATGYLGSFTLITSGGVSTATLTTGFGVRNNTATDLINGEITISNLSGNTWVVSGILSGSNVAETYITSGSKALSGALTQVRITTVNGTDAFDAGSINVMYA
jgi:hypothetical protein